MKAETLPTFFTAACVLESPHECLVHRCVLNDTRRVVPIGSIALCVREGCEDQTMGGLG